MHLSVMLCCRTSLQRELTAFSYEVVDLVLNIYDTNLEAIREQFQRHGGQLTAVRR